MIGRDLWREILRLRTEMQVEEVLPKWQEEHREKYVDILTYINSKVEIASSSWNNNHFLQNECKMTRKPKYPDEVWFHPDYDWAFMEK